MKRKSILLVVLAILPDIVSALGLGNIDLRSELNQPFEARIELLSVTAEELSTLRVGLADLSAFQRAGVDRPFVLSELRFTVEETESGPDYILITTLDSVREPFLNFLVEANWSRGRLLREYTVLLDPPLYDPGYGSALKSTIPAVEPVSDTGSVTTTTTGEPTGSGRVSALSQQGIDGSEYGPIASGDTLWSIASRSRPDASVSIQQMMLALQRANPDVFINNNINGLKRGQVLRIPDNDEISAISSNEALAEVISQNTVWESTRGSIATATPIRPAGAEIETETEGVASTPEPEEEVSDAELRLVAPGGQAAGTGSGDSALAVEEAGVDEQISLANEQIEAISVEHIDLRDKMTESESIIEDLQRLISLKDEELATIQQQLAGTAQGESAAEDSIPAITEETAVTDTTPQEEPVASTAETGQVSEVPVSTPPASVPAAPETVQAPAGIMGAIKTVILENLLVIIVGLAGVASVIGLLLFVSSRKRAQADAMPVADTTDFPGVDSSEDETIIPGEESAAEFDDSEAITDVGKYAEKIDSDEIAPAPQPDISADVEKTEFAFEEEEDALAEVNVFLAYEHFDQAEEFVREAIAGDPENLDYHTKLLEVFYASGNKKAYEAEAKVLQGLVNSQGSHWEMALAMWQELSPSRALFAAPSDDEETSAAPTTGGGIVDLTAEGSEKPDTGSMLDFNFGLDEPAKAPVAKSAMLDITSNRNDLLDITAAVTSEEKEDLLDVTAAVRLEPESLETTTAGAAENDVFNLAYRQDDEVLDITAAAGTNDDGNKAADIEDAGLDFSLGDTGPADRGDLLDVSQGGGEDLLDVTHAHPDLQHDDFEEDLLDVTSATAAGLDARALFEVTDDATGDVSGYKDNSLDFPKGGSGAADNVIDFDIGSANELSLELDGSGSGGQSEGLELEALGSSETAQTAETGLELTLDDSSEQEFSLDIGDSSTTGEGDTFEVGDLEISQGGIDLDLMGNDSTDDDIDFSNTMELPRRALDPKHKLSSTGSGNEFDLQIEDEQDRNENDSTMQLSELELEMDDEEDEAEHTVFVPRTSDTEEQSEADEIATKLDLAKAYVELGDSDSAKTILQEVITGGNADQQRQARELLRQCG
ncbi:MAG: hypothetical protein A3I78_05600 [Gammaproteobacteria bacterium RIFCSPLOWO2_02_FULL_56_15]|nr:MAG: hypothetical protein A3I78_05600 [Gammaproteobacteria bacterium RIFCSPLOWO2_02_FULL_56_15]